MSGWVWGLIAVLVLVLVLAGCNRKLFSNEPFIDAKRDAQGNVVIRDTLRMWQDFTGSVDRDVEREQAGVRPSGGTPTWNQHWLLRMKAYSTDQENAPKYLAYIVEARRKAGLPELSGLDDVVEEDR